ncbi:MAG: hypothetical protein WKF43_06420 [Acidimicrobiales bacterium]
MSDRPTSTADTEPQILVGVSFEDIFRARGSSPQPSAWPPRARSCSTMR